MNRTGFGGIMMNKKVLRVLGIISIPVMYVVFFLAIKYLWFLKFSYDLLFFATVGIAFVSLHFFLNIKKMYEWIFRFRYLICGVVFAFLVAGGYHGSSIGNWNYYINTDTQIESGSPIFGVPRAIRSDEWLVNTSFNLSQADSKVNFSSTNSLINGKDTKVNFYPRLIVKDVGIIMHPEQWGYLFLPLENAFSWNWYFQIFVGLLVAIELFMLITKKNKLYSTLGAFLLIISAPAFWWNGCQYVLYGALALLIINKFINTKQVKTRLVLAIALGWVAACYVTLMYPAWMVPYAYLFLMIFIWMLIENKEKIKWKDLLYLIITAVVCGTLFLPLYLGSTDIFQIVTNTVYPGSRQTYGGGSWQLLFTYISNIFFPYKEIGNPCEYSQFLSLFPLPLIMGMYYLYKNKKENHKIDWFLLLVGAFTIVLAIWSAVPLPKLFSKLTLLTMSTTYRAQLVVGVGNIFMLIYILSRYENIKNKKIEKSDNVLMIALSLLISIAVLWWSSSLINEVFEGYLTSAMNIISLIFFIPVFYLVMRNHKKTNFILFIALMGLNLLTSVIIAPISKGLGVIYEKPFAKEIQQIVSEEPDARFITVDSGIVLSNYILVNGGITISTTNQVPNLELWHKLDPEEKFNDVYNRYSHVTIMLTEEETTFELAQTDAFYLNLNYNDICKMDVNYIASFKKQDEHLEYYSEVYAEDGTYIYKTTCN